MSPEAPAPPTSQTPRSGTTGFRLVAALLGLAVGLGLAEAIVRATHVEGVLLGKLAHTALFSDLEGIARPSEDPVLVYEHTPGFEGVGPNLPFGDPRPGVRINDRGMRDGPRTVAKGPQTLRILAFGGSNTFGAGTSDDHTWPAQLERVLAERLGRPVEVWNFGVSAYQTLQKVQQARLVVDELEPDLLLFQLHNRHPRPVLTTEPREVLRLYQRDPRLYAENVGAMGSDSLVRPGGILFRSALARVLTLLREVRQRQGLAPLEPWWGEAPAHVTIADDAFSAFVADVGSRIPIVEVTTPATVAPAPWRDAPKTLDLGRRDVPDLFGIRHIHPGREVYAWYAETIANDLIAANCLTGRPQDCALPDGPEH